MTRTRNISPLVLMTIVALVITSCQKTELSLPATDPSITVTKQELVVPSNLVVPEGNKLIFHAYASGVQIYVVTVSPTDPNAYVWTFVAPDATLFADAGYNGAVGIHYLGPTWESNSGSKVVGSVLQRADAPDPTTAIQWLLLTAVSSEGPGIFSDVTYIQRVNTTGGRAPATGADAAHLGEQVEVPYTAEYYFYKAQ